MQQVVLDTNVLVAALRSQRGASYQLIRMIGLGRFRTNISVALALEYEDVLKRKHVLPNITETDIDEFLDYLFSVSILIPSVPRLRPTLPDPGDECILEVAVDCNAVIITHNTRDFAGAEKFQTLVQTPGEFLKAMRKNS